MCSLLRQLLFFPPLFLSQFSHYDRCDDAVVSGNGINVHGGIMRLIPLIVLMMSLTGCIATYRDFPVDALGKKPPAGTCDVMHYKVKKFDILDSGGYSKLQEYFRDASICKKMIQSDEIPEKGLFLEVETKWKPITMPALIFGYLSVSTLTILPAWSTHDGYIVKYDFYQDGKKKETYRYEFTRKAGLWLGLLPFAWINALTYSEEDAFTATANQFSADAQVLFGSQIPLNDSSPRN